MMQETNIREQLAKANQTFRKLFSSVPNDQINTVPFKDSWTPAQVAQHVFKSEAGMWQALQIAGTKTDRDAFAGVSRLKQIFLDFTTKLKSPEMAVPEQKIYYKEELVQQLDDIAERLSESILNINSDELVTGLPTGDLTKGEIIHFLLYHTQRHIHQLERIIEYLNNKATVIKTHNEAIRRVNEAFSNNDIEAFLSCCTEDITWNIVGETVTTSKESIRKMMTDLPGAAPDMLIHEVFSGEDTGVCTGTFAMMKKSGDKRNFHFCDVYHFTGGKIQNMDSYVVEMKK